MVLPIGRPYNAFFGLATLRDTQALSKKQNVDYEPEYLT